MIEKLKEELEKWYEDIEIWQEIRVTKTFQQQREGLSINNVTKMETAVRVFKDSKVGFVFLSGEDFDKNSLLDNLNLSLCHSTQDDCYILPEIEKGDRVFGSIKESIDKSKALEIIKGMEDTSKRLPHLKGIERLVVADEKVFVKLYNSRAGYLEQKLNKITVGAVVIVGKDGEEKIEWDAESDESTQNLDVSGIVERSYERGIKVLNSSPTYTGSYPVLLENRSACEFLEVLAKSFLAENIYKKKSLLDRIESFSGLITIVEEPHSPKGDRTCYFDGEGIETQRKVLVEKGVVKGMLCDTFYGKKMGKKSSGNAVRSTVTAPPKNGYTNIHLIGEGESIEKKVRDYERVIVVTSLIGMHLVNPVTGDVSVGFEGYLLERGEYKKALSGMILTGNLKEMFKNVVAVGDDRGYYGSMSSPSLLIETMSFAGI